MKIEKLNENQIRCTLTKEDLESRHLNLSELAYGTEKAKSLFREMMRFASYKFGFDAEDIPLMIEAVPVSSDAIVLIVTKVPFPDELDARFSEFTDYDEDEEDDDEYYDEEISSTVPIPDNLGSANDILELFSDEENAKEDEAFRNAVENGMPAPSKKTAEIAEISRLFEFTSLDDVMNAAKVIGSYYHGRNDLYINDDNNFYLIACISDHSPAEFNKVCNTLTEYAALCPVSIGRYKYINEHCRLILEGSALASLDAV
ncbi:MAG: adaptor protein MecA [Lachnospiraceae bacterium]|nr:adaptor protein MecA [Lachnospiraceae bacterium]